MMFENSGSVIVRVIVSSLETCVEIGLLPFIRYNACAASAWMLTGDQ